MNGGMDSEERESLSSNGGPFPIDILSLILALLPVKNLQRLKIVCKSWLALIASPHFGNLHFRSNSLSDDRLLIVDVGNRSLYSVSLDFPQLPAIEFTSYFQNQGFRCKRVIGSCNGLLLCRCIGVSHFSFVVINPSTLQYKLIPDWKVPKKYDSLVSNYGFGYDCSTDDYKVVRVIYRTKGLVLIGKQVMVYSLRNECWKLVEKSKVLYDRPSCRNGALVGNHLLHWVFWYGSLREHRIASFDVCSKQWGVVPMPDYVESGPVNPSNTRDSMNVGIGNDRTYDMIDLGVLDGCLCLLTKNFRRQFGWVDVWVMKEYGVKESWMKLFDTSDMNLTGLLQVAPTTYSEDGNEILLRPLCSKRVLWYDVKEKRARNAEFQGVQNHRQVSVCIRSLVPLPGYGSIGGEN